MSVHVHDNTGPVTTGPLSPHHAATAACAIPGTPLDLAKAGIDACVHCGFCLQACPTYLTLADENDSPRGRVLLMRALVEGTLPLDDASVRTHIDRCLGCRGCETACPSGVPYGHLLEATRATIAGRHPLVARTVLAVFRHEWLLRPILLGGRVLTTATTDALGQVTGFLVFENSIFALGVVAAYGLPGIVEAGVFLEVLVVVLLMEGVIVQIRREHDSLDVDRLRELRG